MTLTLHGVYFPFPLISLLLQVLGQTDNCPTAYHILSRGKCYRNYQNKLSWADSKVECERLYSSLAEFESREQASDVFYSYPYSYWVGVYDYKPEQSWVWISDNKTVNMSYWNERPEDLNDTCGYLYYAGGPKISVKNCASTLFYICMSLPVAPITTTFTTEASTTSTTSTTEVSTTSTRSTTESTATTTTSTTEAPTTATNIHSKETTSLSSQKSTYSSSQTSTTTEATTMSTITNTNSRIGNILETTTQCRGLMLKALPILLSLNLVIFVI